MAGWLAGWLACLLAGWLSICRSGVREGFRPTHEITVKPPSFCESARLMNFSESPLTLSSVKDQSIRFQERLQEHERKNEEQLQ